MPIKTLLSARQVLSYKNKRKGAITPTKVMGKVEELVDRGVLEFVPWSNFSRKGGDFTFRDCSEGVYLSYQKITFPEGDVLERLTAAIPKAREKTFDVYNYARQFKKTHFSDL